MKLTHTTYVVWELDQNPNQWVQLSELSDKLSNFSCKTVIQINVWYLSNLISDFSDYIMPSQRSKINWERIAMLERKANSHVYGCLHQVFHIGP